MSISIKGLAVLGAGALVCAPIFAQTMPAAVAQRAAAK